MKIRLQITDITTLLPPLRLSGGGGNGDDDNVEMTDALGTSGDMGNAGGSKNSILAGELKGKEDA